MPTSPEREDLRAQLSPIQYAVTQEARTEPQFSGAYWDHHNEGTYRWTEWPGRAKHHEGLHGGPSRKR